MIYAIEPDPAAILTYTVDNSLSIHLYRFYNPSLVFNPKCCEIKTQNKNVTIKIKP